MLGSSVIYKTRRKVWIVEIVPRRLSRGRLNGYCMGDTDWIRTGMATDFMDLIHPSQLLS